MGGFIVLEDGRAFAVANWAWRQAIQKIGEALATIPGRTAFAQWFAMIVELPAGLNELDLRELTPGNRGSVPRGDAYCHPTCRIYGIARLARARIFRRVAGRNVKFFRTSHEGCTLRLPGLNRNPDSVFLRRALRFVVPRVGMPRDPDPRVVREDHRHPLRGIRASIYADDPAGVDGVAAAAAAAVVDGDPSGATGGVEESVEDGPVGEGSFQVPMSNCSEPARSGGVKLLTCRPMNPF